MQNCSSEFSYYDVAIDKETGYKTGNVIKCPYCSYESLSKNYLKAREAYYDDFINETIEVIKEKPVLINYSYNGKKYEKIPDDEDLLLLKKINDFKITKNIPIIKLPLGYNTKQPKISHEINYTSFLYKKKFNCIFNIMGYYRKRT